MSLIFLAVAAAVANPVPSPSANEARFAACVALVESDAQKAVDEATSWQVVGGGLLARQCLGLAFAAQSRWVPAMTAFEQAAGEADRMRDGRAARLWVQAGNAALAATQAAKARGYFDVALVSGQLAGAEKGEAHLDRARALVALRQVTQARADLDEAIKLVPEDPLAWLLSATLARRSGDLARASTDIDEAVKRAPDDPQVALEAGNIALMQGSEAAARIAWAGAVKLAPQSLSGKAAAAALEQLDGAARVP
jgi:tetratricopeptide (TPR) repeat protein